MSRTSSPIEAKLPERITSAVKSAKKRSTRFIHDDDVGVKWDLKRGWRSSHALDNYHTKIEFLEFEVRNRNLTMVCDKAMFIWFHEVRNGQYHIGGATIPQERELEGIRAAAIWVFS